MAEKKLSFTAEEIDSLLKQVKEGGGGGPVSWNDIQDKPFGIEVTTFVDNQAIAIGEDGSGLITPTVVLIEGQEYIITYNGVEYRRTAKWSGSFGMMYVGNSLGVSEEDTGEPFTIAALDGVSAILAIDGSTEVILTVIGPKIKIIDKVYIPNLSVKFYFTTDTSATMYIYKDEERTEKLTKDELWGFIDRGFLIMFESNAYEIFYPARIEPRGLPYGFVHVLNLSEWGAENYSLYTAEL